MKVDLFLQTETFYPIAIRRQYFSLGKKSPDIFYIEN